MSSFFRSGAIVLVFSVPFFQSHAQVGTAFDGFLGHWTGNGAIHLKNGKDEAIRCIGNYVGGGASLQQRVRCAGTDFKIETVSQLQLSGSQISGTFEITTFSAQGTVSGTASANALSLHARAPKFTSSLIVSLPAKCRQQIRITPADAEEVRSITVNLVRSRCK